MDATGADTLTDPMDPTSTTLVTRSVVPGAANSSRFFTIFTDAYTGTTKHCSQAGGTGPCIPWLSVDELKLLSEWVDIGAQYYNNPFAAPMN